MKSLSVFVILLCLVTQLFPQRGEGELQKSIAYYLVKDMKMAKKHMDAFLNRERNVNLKNGFNLLLQEKNWDSAVQFKRYLDIYHRSPKGLVGMFLATMDMENSTAIENLNRALKSSPSYNPALLCLGYESMRRKNYPQAERYLNRAYNISKTTEYKIILSLLYLEINEPKIVLDLVRREANKYLDNIHYNYLTAKAFYKLGNLGEMKAYLDRVVQMDATNLEAKLLLAKYYLSQNNPKQARQILQVLKFPQYNLDYVKTYAQALLELNDRKAKDYLLEIFAQRRWDNDINRMMALYNKQKKKGGNVQNWIYRMILSGDSIEKIKALFPGDYRYPQFDFIPFFDVQTVHWISGRELLVAAQKKSGGSSAMYLIDTNNYKILKTMPFLGKFQKIFFSPKKNMAIFSTVKKQNESIYVYSLSLNGYRSLIKPVFYDRVKMESIHAGFSKTSPTAYITNGALVNLAFESPFSIVGAYGKKLIYPAFPYAVYRFDFKTMRASKVKEVSRLGSIPIPEVRKYSLIADAYQYNPDIKRLIQKGKDLDLTSYEVIRTKFSKNLGSVMVYLSSSKIFDAYIYSGETNKATKIDGSMFVGKGSYADLKIYDIWPNRHELMIVTTDKNRTLIAYNYQTHLHNKITKKVLSTSFDPDRNVLYVLTERSDKVYYKETRLEVFSFDPFSKKIIDNRRNLNQILSYGNGFGESKFSTNDGEWVRMDDDNNFHYVGPSLEGCPHGTSPSGRKNAAFINGKLWFF